MTSSLPLLTLTVREDAELFKKYDAHLSSIRRLYSFVETSVCYLDDADTPIESQFASARIVLFLLSEDALNALFAFPEKLANRSLVEALLWRRTAPGPSFVLIPILLRPCRWQRPGNPFHHLAVIPVGKQGEVQPVTAWDSRDEALTEVIQGIEKIIDKMIAPPPSQQDPFSEASLPTPAWSSQTEDFAVSSFADVSPSWPAVPLRAPIGCALVVYATKDLPFLQPCISALKAEDIAVLDCYEYTGKGDLERFRSFIQQADVLIVLLSSDLISEAYDTGDMTIPSLLLSPEVPTILRERSFCVVLRTCSYTSFSQLVAQSSTPRLVFGANRQPLNKMRRPDEYWHALAQQVRENLVPDGQE